VRVVTVVCLSHFRKTAAKSLTLEMKLSPPLFTISTWTESVFLHTHTQMHTQLQEEKKIQTVVKPPDLFPEWEDRGRVLEGHPLPSLSKSVASQC